MSLLIQTTGVTITIGVIVLFMCQTTAGDLRKKFFILTEQILKNHKLMRRLMHLIDFL